MSATETKNKSESPLRKELEEYQTKTIQLYTKEGAKLPNDIEHQKIHPDEFNNIVVGSVNKYLDDDIYKDGLEEHKETYSEEYIKTARNYLVREFAEELEQ